MENTNHNGTSDMILLSVITIIHSSDVHSFIHSFIQIIHTFKFQKKIIKEGKRTEKKKKKKIERS